MMMMANLVKKKPPCKAECLITLGKHVPQSTQIDAGKHPQSLTSAPRQFYPPDFETDRNGEQNTWESVVLIPFIDEDLMVSALSQVDHRAALSEEEHARNILGKEHTFWPAKGRGPPIGQQLKGVPAGNGDGKNQYAHKGGVPKKMAEPEEFDD